MGEYARTLAGDEIKIGTCESMYYLRHDQRHLVRHVSGNVDPVRQAGEIRFRFPWPDEDNVQPGGAEFGENGYQRSIAADGFTAPEVEHFSVQFAAHAGYLTSLPCPESAEYVDAGSGRLMTTHASGLHVHRNGFSGAVKLVAQRSIAGVGLVPVLMCGGCGAMWREEEPARLEELAVCFRSIADREARTGGRPDFYHAIADRVLAGGPAALAAATA